MPKLWTQTIEGHRAAVWQAVVDTTAALVAEGGLRAVTMSQVAEKVGIGRATLYKYFPDVDSIMFAWHEQQVAHHLEHLKKLAETPATPSQRLGTVLERYALNRHEHSGHDLAGLLHQGPHMAHAENALAEFLEELLRAGARAGEVRDDIAPKELATYCIHALSAAPDLPSKAAVKRLVALTSTALATGAATSEQNHPGESE
ncbi:MAG: TetR/AcrR family transcriptional regulator [Propionicimonas sp.]